MALSRMQIQPDDLDAVMLLNPDNKQYLAGKKKYPATSANGCALPFMSVFLLVGIFIIGIAIKAWYDYFLLTSEGISAWATYVDKRIDHDDDVDNYYITFTYQVDGVTYTDEAGVSSELYDSVPNGEPLRITYALSNPSIVTMGEPSSALALGMTAFAIFWNLFNGGITYVLIYDIWWVRQFTSSGRLILGEVVHSKASGDSDGNYTVSIGYGFTSPTSNRWIKGKASHVRNDLKPKGKNDKAKKDMSVPEFEQGQPLLIAYLDDKKHRVL